VDSNRYMIEKSARTLRGMSWWGSVVNYFTEEPAAPRPRTAAWMTRPEAQAAAATAAAAAESVADSTAAASSKGQWNERDGQAGDGVDDRRELFMRRAGSGGAADEARAVRVSQAPSVSPPLLTKAMGGLRGWVWAPRSSRSRSQWTRA
jgi:hypothetical protein